MQRPKKFEQQLLKYLLIATLVPAIALVVALFYYQASYNFIAIIILSLFCLTGFCASTLYQKITFQLRTLSNLLEGMTHGDYSLRGRRYSNDTDDALGQLVSQINQLANTLLSQRYAATESQILVKKVIQHIDVAIIATDEKDHIALVNPAAEKLLNIEASSAIGKPISQMDASHILTIEGEEVMDLSFADKTGKFRVIRDQYRDHGSQHQLFFITDVNDLLREQEKQAWQNLIRVLSHEINNSLSPITSIADTLTSFTAQIENSAAKENFDEGLAVISERATSLSQFIQSYRQLTHLPAPQLQPIELHDYLKKFPPLFAHRQIKIACPNNITAYCDPVLIEQVIINLIKNADEATKDSSQTILLNGTKQQQRIYIDIIDSGIGIQSKSNLFTPFYSTKAQGSGIGLVLSRQIIEAHQGTLSLTNRAETLGCIARIDLPNH